MAKQKKGKSSQENLSKYVNRIEAAERQRDGNYKELWSRCYKRYRNFTAQLKDKERSNISIPYIFTQVETVLPRLVESLFASRPYVSFTNRKYGYDTHAKKMETLVDWQMNERFDVQDLFHTGLKEMSIYGTTIGFCGWKYCERKSISKQNVPATIQNEDGTIAPVLDELNNPVMTLKPVESMEIEYDDPEVQFIDLGLFFVDPNAEDIDDAEYCGHTCYKSKSYLKSMEANGFWKIDWRKLENSNRNNEARSYRMSQVGLTNNSNVSDVDDGLYQIDHYWEDDKYVVIINRCHIAKETENPYWHKRKPYVKAVYTRVPHEFYGMGIVEVLEDMQDELNNERNMRIDYRKFALRRMFKVRRSANIDKRQLVWKQGGVIDVEEMDDVEEFRIDQSANNSYTEEGTIKQDMKDASGAQDITMGLSSSSETATTTMSKDNNASARFKLIISNVEKRLLVGISRLMMKMNQQLIDSERMFKITGQKDWTTVSPDEIQGEFDMFAAGSSVEPLANKDAHKQRMVELYGLLVNDPLMQQFPAGKMKILKKIIESFGLDEVDDILPDDDVIQQMLINQFNNTGNLGSPNQPPTPQPINTDALGTGANQAIQEPQGMIAQGGGY